jgi:DNA-directed RNA polymerase subunit omega
MIEALKSDEIVHKLGGRFKVCALIQHRWVELINGARPLVERAGRSDLEVIIDEILQGKVAINREASNVTAPDEALGNV